MKRRTAVGIRLVRIGSGLEQRLQSFNRRQFTPFVYCVEHNWTPPLVRLVGVAYPVETLRCRNEDMSGFAITGMQYLFFVCFRPDG